MTMIDSASSQVAAFGYDAATRTLRVRFRKGGTWEYADVPPEKFAAMQDAPSVGSFLHWQVKPHHAASKLLEAALAAAPAPAPCEHKEWVGTPEVDARCKACGMDEFEVNAQNVAAIQADAARQFAAALAVGVDAEQAARQAAEKKSLDHNGRKT